MSVAFRRDGDEEHLEPKFEVPIPPGPNLVTQAGMALIHQRLEELEATVSNLTGGSDETTLNAAKRDLRYWRKRLATAEIQPAPDGQTVQFGCTVRFRLDDKERQITIVGHDEADPSSGNLAFISPLARAMMGAEKGDILDFKGQEEVLEILEIQP